MPRFNQKKYHGPNKSALAYQQKNSGCNDSSHFIFSATMRLNFDTTGGAVCLILFASLLAVPANGKSNTDRGPLQVNHGSSSSLTLWKPNFEGVSAAVVEIDNCWTESIYSSSVALGTGAQTVCVYQTKSHYFSPLEKKSHVTAMDYHLRFIKDCLGIHVPESVFVYNKYDAKFYLTTEKQEDWKAGVLYESFPGEECFSSRTKLAKEIGEEQIAKFIVANSFLRLNGLNWGIVGTKLSINSVWTSSLQLKSVEDYADLFITKLGAPYTNKDSMLHDSIALTRNDLAEMKKIYAALKTTPLPKARFKSSQVFNKELYFEVLDLYLTACIKTQALINRFAPSFTEDLPNYEINRILAGFIAKKSKIALPYNKINWDSFEQGYFFETPAYGTRC